MSATKERVASVRTRRKITCVTPNYPQAERKKSGRKRTLQISQSQSCASNCRKCGDGKRGSIFQTDDVPSATQWTAIRTNQLLVIAVSWPGRLHYTAASGKLAFGGGMKYWSASVVAILMASFPGVVSAQVDCNAVPAGPARTDCYIGLGRVYRRQSDVTAGDARVQSDAARLQQVTGTGGRSKASKHRRNRAVTVGPE
jgi:hypothetical protein